MEMGKALEVGDEGIWVTYARGMKNKAVREFTAMCHEVKQRQRSSLEGFQEVSELHLVSTDNDKMMAVR